MVNSLYRHFGKGLFWVTINQVVSMVVAILTTILLANYFSPEVFGKYRYLTSLGVILPTLALSGMNTALTQAVARGFEGNYHEAMVKQLKWSIIPFSITVALTLFYLANQNSPLGFGVLLVGLTLPVINVINTYKSFLLGKQEFRLLTAFGLFNSLVPLGGILLAANFFPTLLPLLFSYLAALLFSNLVCFFISLKLFPPNNRRDPKMISFGKKISLLNVFSIVSQYLDTFFVFHFFGSTPLALYALTLSFPEQIRNFMRMVPTVVLTRASAESNFKVHQNLPSRLTAYFLISLGVVMAYLVVSPLIIPFLFPKYLAILPLIPLASLLIFASLADYLESIMTSKKLTGDLAVVSLVRALFLLTSTLVLGGLFQIPGLLLAKILSHFVVILLEGILISRALRKSD